MSYVPNTATQKQMKYMMVRYSNNRYKVIHKPYIVLKIILFSTNIALISSITSSCYMCFSPCMNSYLSATRKGIGTVLDLRPI